MSSDRGERRAHLTVSGRVQGVFFRASAAREAALLRLKGWVRNLSDGRVEAVFQGDPDAVVTMVEWCRTGPQFAQVEALEVSWEDPDPAEAAFDWR